MEYTAVIRTLGRAGEKYQMLLDSLNRQTLPPKEILVYIAEGYSLPKETIGKEKYIYVRKGMMAQRALPYDEVTTEYVLFLDDDLYIPEDSIETMFTLMLNNKADVISPDIYPNATRPLKSEIMMTISGRMKARRKRDGWGYKIMRNGGYSYAKFPEEDVLLSQTNAGACFLCRKCDFLKIHLEDERWIDAVPYALGDDQVIYYKMYLNGLKILTWYSHSLIHLDGGQNYTKEKEIALIYSDFRFKTIFWYRFIYLVDRRQVSRIVNIICFIYTILFSCLVSIIKLDWKILRTKIVAVKDARRCIESIEFRNLPLVRIV